MDGREGEGCPGGHHLPFWQLVWAVRAWEKNISHSVYRCVSFCTAAYLGNTEIQNILEMKQEEIRVVYKIQAV